MQIKTLKNTSIDSILDSFNDSFSDYILPFKMNKEQLKAKIEIENIDLDISVGAFDNGKLVGFILHGFRRINGRNLVYNGGTGVLPEKRGNNLTIRMYNFILPFFHKLKIHSLQLEVISNNLYAINAYKKVGFSYLRACLKIFIF